VFECVCGVCLRVCVLWLRLCVVCVYMCVVCVYVCVFVCVVCVFACICVCDCVCVWCVCVVCLPEHNACDTLTHKVSAVWLCVKITEWFCAPVCSLQSVLP